MSEDKTENLGALHGSSHIPFGDKKPCKTKLQYTVWSWTTRRLGGERIIWSQHIRVFAITVARYPGGSLDCEGLDLILDGDCMVSPSTGLAESLMS